MSTKLDWIKAGTAIAATGVAIVRAVMDYRQFRSDRERMSYHRDLQKEAWEQVMSGLLDEAQIGDVHIKGRKAK